MTNEIGKEKVRAIIKEMAEDVKDVVKEIEEKDPSTRNHYAKYASIIKALTREKGSSMKYAVGLALIEAGANPQGVRDAVSLIEENLI